MLFNDVVEASKDIKTMVLDFDVEVYVDNLKATKPPYTCPVGNCGKTYKSHKGIQFHLLNHEAGDRIGNKSVARSPSPDVFRAIARDTLTYAEAQRLVEVDLDGKLHRINIYEPLEVISSEEVESLSPCSKHNQTIAAKVARSTDAMCFHKDPPVATPVASLPGDCPKLPQAVYKVIEDNEKHCAPVRHSAYYRYIEQSPEKLDEMVEYDMDEEDYAWLSLINEQRGQNHLPEVTPEIFELLMDRFEKEAHFQSQSSGQEQGPPIDEDAVCSICMDGECQNSNVILFCDMCNLAVHQECYGVPYVPEGQWLCRRCLQSPSRAVDCCLCPNKGGAFKETDDNRWAHVVCALWIPEVGFANTVFLEPIDGLLKIPPARWKLTCYICKQRGAGAAIQCHKPNCYTAMHVTCAQHSGLYMKIEAVKESGSSSSVRKTAYCDVHTPADMNFRPMINNGTSEDESKTVSVSQAKVISRDKIRRARKMLAEKRNAMPIVSIPIIPEARLTKIASKVNMAKKNLFLGRLQSYWTLKRQSRNGVPLLRRLQTSHVSSRQDGEKDEETVALKAKMKYWQRLRQDLEKARLLIELIRKREKLKREQLRLHEMSVDFKLQPFNIVLRNALQQLYDIDTMQIFHLPVSKKEVPDYYDHIKNPMDFSTMKKKINDHEYKSVELFEKDFNLIVSNCMTYNPKETIFYKAAIKLRDQGGAVVRAMRRMVDKVGFDTVTGFHGEHTPEVDSSAGSDKVCSLTTQEIRSDLPLEEQLTLLLDKLDMAQMQKQSRKSKVARSIRKEIMKVRRQLALQKGQDNSFVVEETTCSESDAAPPTSPDPPTLQPEMPILKAGKTEVPAVKSNKSRTRSQTAEEDTPKAIPVVTARKQSKQISCAEVSSSPVGGPHIPDMPALQPHSRASFTQYRSLRPGLSDLENTTTDMGTSDSDFSSDSDSSVSTSSDDAQQRKRARCKGRGWSGEEEIPLEPLDLIWAKCRGYPWYPALIINPKMPKTGYFHNGVPIPVPPDDVLALAKRYPQPMYLVLFFDAKRTWQWLPRNKLEPLGVDSGLDESKLEESKKQNIRRAVRAAYEKAVAHRCRVTGEENLLPMQEQAADA